jgi:potassium channel subfamily K
MPELDLTLFRLVVINAVSLFVVVLAYISLLLKMAHHLPFNIAQGITITGWYISSILLLVIIALIPTSSKLLHHI